MTPRRRDRCEQGFTLIELMIVLAIIAILLTIPIASYLSYRDRANDVTAEADVHVIVPSVEAYYSDRASYAGMTLLGLKASYDQSIDPDVYTLTSLTSSSYCVSAMHGDKSWRKAGPAATIESGACT